MGSRHLWIITALAASLSLVAVPGHADDYQEASRLFKQGRHAAALEKVDAVLAGSPKDARARFLKGLILTEQDRAADAIKVFTGLTQDYPELPEPYNNLAVLYAAQGKYEESRKALEMAIRTHPSYAVAHENLGDVYAKMASEAYDKALQLDNSNRTAKTKLALIRELFSGVTAVPAAKPSADTAAPVAAQAPTPAAAAPKPPAPQPQTQPQPSSAPAPADRSQEVLSAVRSWAKAWSDQNVNAYLSHYAKNFDTGSEGWDAWASTRRDRITRPKQINVDVRSPKVEFEASDRAKVTFEQAYRSDNLNSTGSKTLTLVRSAERWLIVREEFSR